MSLVPNFSWCVTGQISGSRFCVWTHPRNRIFESEHTLDGCLSNCGTCTLHQEFPCHKQPFLIPTPQPQWRLKEEGDKVKVRRLYQLFMLIKITLDKLFQFALFAWLRRRPRWWSQLSQQLSVIWLVLASELWLQANDDLRQKKSNISSCPCDMRTPTLLAYWSRHRSHAWLGNGPRNQVDNCLSFHGTRRCPWTTGRF